MSRSKRIQEGALTPERAPDGPPADTTLTPLFTPPKRPEPEGIGDPTRETLAQRKREVRDPQHREREAKRAQRRLERRCFWIWPWGHAWRRDPAYNRVIRTCVSCGKVDDPAWSGQ